MSPSSPEPDQALPAATAIGEVVAAADLAIEEVAASARSQIVELETTFEQRLVEESVKRRAGLGLLRVELAERAARLAAAYAETAEHLGEIDAALRQLGEPAAGRADREPAEAPPVKITLRERRTHFGGIEPAEEEVSTELFGGQSEPEAAPRPRRSWRIWQRNAA
jgi:hypothetical protein